MKKTKEIENPVEQALKSIEDTIAKFGLKSMEVADLFLRIAGAIFQVTGEEDPNTPIRLDVLTDGGRTRISPLILDRYIFGDPSLTEAHLTQIETAFAFAMPTWSKTNPNAVDSAVHTLHILARSYADVGDSDKWEALCKRALNICRTHLGQNHSAVAQVLGDMGSHYAALGRLDEADACLKDGLKICDSDSDFRIAEASKLLSDSARVATARGQFVMARMFLDQAIEILEQAPTKDKVILLGTLIDYAGLLQKIGDLKEFDQVNLRAEKVAKEAWESNPHAAVTLTLILIHCNESFGRFDDAERLSQWLAGKLRVLASEGGIDVLDRLREGLLAVYPPEGMPLALEKLMSRITAERDGLTFR